MKNKNLFINNINNINKFKFAFFIFLFIILISIFYKNYFYIIEGKKDMGKQAKKKEKNLNKGLDIMDSV
jgi:preprotein translocase subunit YajC